MYRTALVVIARNEARCIGRCLASAREWVDSMLVLDTGSTDDTVARARAEGARVESFTWVDDFAAARNRALDTAGADWHIVLDADEWLKEGGAALAALRQAEPAFVGAVRLDNEIGAQEGDVCAPSWLSRVLPGGVRYAGRIHEQPVHSLPLRRLPVAVGHTGYLPQAMAAKRGRNAALLQRALQEAPGDGYLHYQLGKDHSVHDRHAAAADCYERAAQAGTPTDSHAHDLLLRRLFALKKCGRHDEAVQLAELHRTAWDASPDYWFTVGDLLLDWACARPDRAGDLLPVIEASWQRCLEIGERPDLEGAVIGRGSYLAAANLAVLCDGTGRAEEARQWRERSAALRR